MKFNQGEIAKIYGMMWETTSESKKDYLRSKLDRLNNIGNLEHFYSTLDLENQRNFKQVLNQKLAFLGGLK